MSPRSRRNDGLHAAYRWDSATTAQRPGTVGRGPTSGGGVDPATVDRHRRESGPTGNGRCGMNAGLVAAVVDQGALTFDLAVPCEVFGVDRSDIAAPWYDFRLVAVDGQVRTSTGFMIDTPHRI